MPSIVVAPYPTDFQKAAPESTSLPAGGAPLSAFGQTLPNDVRQVSGEGQALERAGARLEQASDNASIIALGMMKDANETAVQDLNNKFITGQQAILYTGDSAFYKKQGKDAIDAAPGATAQLQDLQKSLIEQTTNAAQRRRFTDISNAHVSETTNGISRQVAIQGVEWQKTVLAAKQANIVQEATNSAGDFEKIKGLADAAEINALKQLETQGLKGDPEATKNAVRAARSQVYSQNIDTMVDGGNRRAALAFYERVRPELATKDQDRLGPKMKSVADDIRGDDFITRETVPASLGGNVTKWAPQVYSAAQKYGVDPTLALAVLTQESGGNEKAVSPKGAGGLMQLMPDTAKGLGVTNVNDANQNIDGGVRYLSEQMAVFKDQRLALMAYNWGPENVKKWMAGGSDPSKIPAETRDYLTKVQGYQAAQTVGFDKANTEALIQKAAQIDDPAVRNNVIAKLRLQTSTTEAMRASTKKNIDEGFAATSQLIMAAPHLVKEGKLAEFADAYKAAGFPAEATNAAIVASMEGTLRTFAQSPKDAQDEINRNIVTGLLPGYAKALAEGLNKAETKVRTDAGKQAGVDEAALKHSIDDLKVDPATMQAKAKDVVSGYVAAKDFVKAQQAIDYYDGAVTAHAAGQAPPPQQVQFNQEMRDSIEKGKQDNHTIAQAVAMRKITDGQAALFKADPFKAGIDLYQGRIGPAVPIDFTKPLDPVALQMRATQAHQISMMQNGMPVPAFNVPEIETLKNALASSPSDQQGRILASLSALPPEQIPLIAAKLAGTENTGDPAARAYAASMAMFADAQQDPTRAVVASQVLKGAELIRAGGASGLKPAVQSETWQQEMQTTVGAAWSDLKASQRAVLSDSIGAHYTYLMSQAGRQGEKTDTDILDKSIKAVVGTTIRMNGSSFYPPVRDMNYYDFANVLGRLTNGDLDGVKTKDGTPVTADLVRREGRLTNVGEGLYMVRISDPRNGGAPGEIPMPNGQKNQVGGDAWLLDGKALMQRTPAGASRDPNAPDYVAAPSLGGPR